MSPVPPTIKKTIPLITVKCNDNGQFAVQSVVENIYLKVLESKVSIESFLSKAGKQMTPERVAGDLCLLDSKLVVISPLQAQRRG